MTTEMQLHKPIEPMQTQKPAVSAAVQYMIVKFGESKWATIRLLLLDEDGLAVAAHDVPMTLEESNAWQGDDEYVLQIALQKLGMSDTSTSTPSPRSIETP